MHISLKGEASQNWLWATSVEQRICRLTSCRVSLKGIALGSAHEHELLALSLLVCLELGGAVSSGRDELLPITIHAWGWDGTRFLVLPCPSLLLSLLNVWLIAPWRSGVLGFVWCLGMGLGRNALRVFSQVYRQHPLLCSQHCLPWQESVFQLHACLHSWIQVSCPHLILSTSTAFNHLVHNCQQRTASFLLLRMCSVSFRQSQRRSLLACTFGVCHPRKCCTEQVSSRKVWSLSCNPFKHCNPICIYHQSIQVMSAGWWVAHQQPLQVPERQSTAWSLALSIAHHGSSLQTHRCRVFSCPFLLLLWRNQEFFFTLLSLRDVTWCDRCLSSFFCRYWLFYCTLSSPNWRAYPHKPFTYCRREAAVTCWTLQPAPCASSSPHLAKRTAYACLISL